MASLHVWLLAAPGIVLASALVAQSPVPTAAPAPAEEKLVCKKIKAAASRLPGSRVCMTKKQWHESEFQARDLARRMQQDKETTHGSN
ncbi:hypothetical protein [Novosphingobium sp. Gsoil 351]|uniref:hypothetical protein n=1 Tax=Novosphingobium sp. Gsoil 351 TaxID=2675225 RepID=UPI0012B4F0CD|nr:hypothetical protein [Novosphingobium sp. Gsoil 351]QGN53895.1 hypothetical protein GKE62_04450 [Novosphingobium sp. Gsoil 351]